MLGHDGGSADVVDLALEQDTHGRRLGLAADHRAMGIAVDDRVADHMDVIPGHRVKRLPQPVERDVVALHDDLELLQLDRGRRKIDQAGRRIDDVSWREDDLAAVGLTHLRLFSGPRRHARGGILEALGEVIRLEQPDILERLGVTIDDDVIHDFEGGQVHRPQVLRHVRPMRSLGDVVIGGDTGDQNVRLALGIDEVPDVSGVNQVKGPVTHDGLFFAGQRSEDVT